MKKINKFIGILISIAITIMMASLSPLSVSAASNPYPSSQTIGGVTTIPCTYYAWQQAYDNTGVAMPNFGNAKNWYSGASSAGYAVGSVAKPKSIAVWSGGTYGHVSYVVSVNGSKMTVNEGGMYNSNGGAYNGNGILNGNVVNSTVGQAKGNGSSKILVGFIYLTETSSGTVTISSQSSKNQISHNNAVVCCDINKPSSYTVTKIGIRVRKDGSTYDNGWSIYQAPIYSNYSGWTAVPISYDFQAELNFTPTHLTKYYYQFYTVTNGKEYWSDEFSITTTGSHSYPIWTTTQAATCTATGSAKRSCSGCSKTETQTLTALGHNYSSSYTTDTAATCTTNGSKSKHCTRCSAKTSVTAIAATGHSWSSWKTVTQPTCTAEGKQQRNCSVCKATETKSIAAKGHSYSSEWTVDIASTCTVAGTKSKHCSSCSSKAAVTTIDATGHNWSEFKTSVSATTEKTGLSVRNCMNSGCTASESKVIAKLAADGHTHSFGEFETIKTATCTEQGEQQRKCTQCNEAENLMLSPIGHNFGEWSSPDENGIITRACSLCGEKEEQIIENVSSEVSLPDNELNNHETDISEDEINVEEENNYFWLILIISLLAAGGIAATVFIVIDKHKQ